MFAVDGDDGALAQLEADGPWIAVARRRRIRRALGRRLLLVWRVAFEDAGGALVESRLVAVTLELSHAVRGPRSRQRIEAIVRALEPQSRAQIEADGRDWREAVDAVLGSFTSTRTARERAIAVGCRDALARSAFQPGLFDRRAERAQRARHSGRGAHRLRRAADRLAAIAPVHTRSVLPRRRAAARARSVGPLHSPCCQASTAISSRAHSSRATCRRSPSPADAERLRRELVAWRARCRHARSGLDAAHDPSIRRGAALRGARVRRRLPRSSRHLRRVAATLRAGSRAVALLVAPWGEALDPLWRLAVDAGRAAIGALVPALRRSPPADRGCEPSLCAASRRVRPGSRDRSPALASPRSGPSSVRRRSPPSRTMRGRSTRWSRRRTATPPACADRCATACSRHRAMCSARSDRTHRPRTSPATRSSRR